MGICVFFDSMEEKMVYLILARISSSFVGNKRVSKLFGICLSFLK